MRFNFLCYRISFQRIALVATRTRVDEPFVPWKAEVVSSKDIIAGDTTLFENVSRLPTDEGTKFLRCNMADGVHRQGVLIWHIVNTEELTDVGMEKEDLGLMMSMFLEVSILCSYQRSILRLKSVIIVLKLKLFAIPPKSNTFFFDWRKTC